MFERDDRIGGLLRYGIPDFKMEKHLIDRRMEQMEAEGVTFRTERATSASTSRSTSCAASSTRSCSSGGATQPRDLPVPGRELKGVHFAMEFLPQQNKVVAGDAVADQILATGKHVVILGGGDTGSDCLGTSQPPGRHVGAPVRAAAASRRTTRTDRHALAVLADDPAHVVARTKRASMRDFSINTEALQRRRRRQRARSCTACASSGRPDNDGRRQMERGARAASSSSTCDLVLLALGFLGPGARTLIAQLGVELDRARQREGRTPTTRRRVPGVFACGDMRRGQSLVVWAIWEGREARAASTRT